MRICVLDDVYDCPAWEAPVDDWRVDPTPFLKSHDWVVEGLTKGSAVARLNQLSRKDFDLFFNLCAGAWDEESPGIEVVRTLEQLNVPFTGATSEFYEPSREAMKRVCSAWDIGYPDYVLARSEEDIVRAAETLHFPLIVKHPSSYSSVDLWKTSRVETTFSLRYRARPLMEKYGSVLIEEFIEGREFTVLVAENPDHLSRPVTYVPVEFVFPEGESFKHSDMKWKDYHSMKEIPLHDGELGDRLRATAADFFLGMRGASFGRCDIRMDRDEKLYMLEINPNCGVYYAPSDPGSADLALLNDPAGHQGFTDLLIRAALARHARKQRGWETRSIPGNGYAVFASREIAQGETIMAFEGTPHTIVSRAWVEKNWGERGKEWFKAYAWPLTEDIWVTWSEDPECWRPINHSCDPNAWLEGLDLVARRPIANGEEIRVDYATYGNNIQAPFDCTCGSSQCRGRVREDDHLQPFMERYGGHISDFVRSARRQAGVE
ncbi:MAG: SET domain-containing protein-lysine N-methyltransferase [Gemmatimonadota bacterium]|jgi:D-alanine-D-alanine ligase